MLFCVKQVLLLVFFEHNLHADAYNKTISSKNDKIFALIPFKYLKIRILFGTHLCKISSQKIEQNPDKGTSLHLF